MFEWKETVEYKDITLLDGRSSRPCSNEPIESHDYEYGMFCEVLDRIDKDSPVMMELGSYWAFWSLAFRKRFHNGRNILVELGKRQLSMGIKNFSMNGFTETHYWGGFHVNDSNVYAPQVRQSNYNYDDHGGYWDTDLVGRMDGPEIQFEDVYCIEKLDEIDLLHIDIQGSEVPLILRLVYEYPKILAKIQNMIIATHHPLAQAELARMLVSNGFALTREEPFGTIGGDGMLVFTKAK